MYELEYDAVNKTAAYGDELELAEPVLAVLAKGCALESFKIAECLMETADDLAALGDCPSLTLLDWGARSSCEAIRSLCRGCPGLLDLTLNEESFPIDPKAVIEIATHCPRLTRLDVAENRKLDDAAVLAPPSFFFIIAVLECCCCNDAADGRVAFAPPAVMRRTFCAAKSNPDSTLSKRRSASSSTAWRADSAARRSPRRSRRGRRPGRGWPLGRRRAPWPARRPSSRPERAGA